MTSDESIDINTNRAGLYMHGKPFSRRNQFLMKIESVKSLAVSSPSCLIYHEKFIRWFSPIYHENPFCLTKNSPWKSQKVSNPFLPEYKPCVLLLGHAVGYCHKSMFYAPGIQRRPHGYHIKWKERTNEALKFILKEEKVCQISPILPTFHNKEINQNLVDGSSYWNRPLLLQLPLQHFRVSCGHKYLLSL